MLGSIQPRLWTPPLRDLAEPGASVGPGQAAFARDVLRTPLDPWQEWLTLHAGELLPDGRPRFWLVLVLVARQNGKTHVPATLAPYWSLIDGVPMILGTSTKVEYAKESFLRAVRLMEQAALRPGDPLHGVIPAQRRQWVRLSNGETSWSLGPPRDPCQYRIAPANAEGGRSLTLDRLIMDELRQHYDRSAWDAAVPATEAVPDAQVWAMSNAGSDRSEVLNTERAAALAYLEHGIGDPGVGIFEWSAPDDADPTDVDALAMANPQLGRRMNTERLIGKAAAAAAQGGERLTGFLTESMCIRVKVLDPAIDPGWWAAAGPIRGRPAVPLTDITPRPALAWDVSPDGLHATVYAAAVDDQGIVHIDPVAAWSGPTASLQLRAELPKIAARTRPRAIGWLPSGPGAMVAADLAAPGKGRRRGPWPPRGVTVEGIRADVTAVCMGLAELARTGQLRHSGDPLLDAQVAGAEKGRRGDGWVFLRAGTAESDGWVDAVYAAAAAAHLARTAPPPLQVTTVLTVPRET